MHISNAFNKHIVACCFGSLSGNNSVLLMPIVDCNDIIQIEQIVAVAIADQKLYKQEKIT